MNKKVIGIIIGLVVVLIIGGIVLKKKGIEPIKGVTALIKPSISLDSPAKFLPKNTVMFYSISDANGLWDQISDSNFWDKFSKLSLWSDFGLKQNMEKIIGVFEEKIGVEITESRIMDLMGNRIILAVTLNPDSNEVKVILQSYVGKKTQVVENMLKSFPEKSASGAKSNEYQGENITLFPSKTDDSPEIRYVLVNNILTLGFGKAEAELKQVIDLTKKVKGGSLVDEENYQKITKLLSGDKDYHSFYYTDFTKISGMLPELLKPLIEAQPEQFAGINLEDVSKNLEQIKLIGGKAFQTKNGISMVSQVVPDFEKMTEEQKQAWKSPLNKIESLQYIPEDTIMVNASGNLNLSKVWDTVTASSGDTQNVFSDFLTTLKDFETNYNMSLKNDIIDKVGNEMAFIFSGVGLDGTFPVPRLGFIVKSKDSKALVGKIVDLIKQSLQGGETALPIVFKEEDIQGNKFHVLETPLGEGLSPVIGNVGEWVIISTNRLNASKYVDAKNGKINLLMKNNSFQKGVPGYDQKLGRLSYANLVGMNDLVKNIINWVLQRKDLIPQTDQVKTITSAISNYADPLLSCLKVFNSMGFFSYTKNDISVQEINLNFEDIK